MTEPSTVLSADASAPSTSTPSITESLLIPQVIMWSDVDIDKIIFSKAVPYFEGRSGPVFSKTSTSYNNSAFYFETPEVDFKLVRNNHGNYGIMVTFSDCPENGDLKTFISRLDSKISSTPFQYRQYEPHQKAILLHFNANQIDDYRATHRGIAQDNLIIDAGVFTYHADANGFLLKQAKRDKHIRTLADLQKILGTAKHNGKFICEFQLIDTSQRIASFRIRQMSINLPKESITTPQTAFQNHYAFSDRPLNQKFLIRGRDILTELDELRELINSAPGVGILYREALPRFTANAQTISVAAATDETVKESTVETTD